MSTPTPINERMLPTLNFFSAAVRDLERIYADGTKGVPMVLDGSWQHFRTVSNRFEDKCNEFDIERFRTTNCKPADLTTPEGLLWVMVQNKIYSVTLSLMTDDVADLYRDELEPRAAASRINAEHGKGRTLWAALEADCGGGQTEVQTVTLTSVTEAERMPDNVSPMQAARLLVTDARSLRPVMSDVHIRDILLKKLPLCMASWTDVIRSRRSDRVGHTDELAGTREILAWLQLEVTNNKTYP